MSKLEKFFNATGLGFGSLNGVEIIKKRYEGDPHCKWLRLGAYPENVKKWPPLDNMEHRIKPKIPILHKWQSALKKSCPFLSNQTLDNIPSTPCTPTAAQRLIVESVAQADLENPSRSSDIYDDLTISVGALPNEHHIQKQALSEEETVLLQDNTIVREMLQARVFPLIFKEQYLHGDY
jgi:hypothetical protein